MVTQHMTVMEEHDVFITLDHGEPRLWTVEHGQVVPLVSTDNPPLGQRNSSLPLIGATDDR